MMQLPPMNAPAVLHRRLGPIDACGSVPSDVIVARGPLIILAYGLLSVSPADRDALWISVEQDNLMPGEVEEAMRRWSGHAA